MRAIRFKTLVGVVVGGVITLLANWWVKRIENRDARRTKLEDRKWDCYSQLVLNYGEVHTLLREAIAARHDPEELAEKQSKVTEAFIKARQSGSIARLAVAPNVRTVLTRVGDEWNRAKGDPVR